MRPTRNTVTKSDFTPGDTTPDSGVRLHVPLPARSGALHPSDGALCPTPLFEAAACSIDARIAELDPRLDLPRFAAQLRVIAAGLDANFIDAHGEHGLLAEIVERAPRLRSQVAALGKRHAAVERELRTLARYATARAPLVFLLHFLTRFRSARRMYVSDELALVQEAHLTDLGVAG